MVGDAEDVGAEEVVGVSEVEVGEDVGTVDVVGVSDVEVSEEVAGGPEAKLVGGGRTSPKLPVQAGIPEMATQLGVADGLYEPIV